jgi:hypothetical protein
MVTDESLVAAHWLIADRGKQYYQEFITELQKESPNNLPDEDAVDWRTRVVDVGGENTMITWVPTSRPKEDIESLRKYLEHHENLYYTDPDNVEISDYEYDMKMKELEKLEKENPEFKSEASPSVRVGFEGSETQATLDEHLKSL